MIPCKPGCAIYNPFLKGCAFMVNLLALGEELAGCRKELSRISGHLELVATQQECIPEAIDGMCAFMTDITSIMRVALEECRGPAAAAEEKRQVVPA
jgi:hypothetical protein